MPSISTIIKILFRAMAMLIVTALLLTLVLNLPPVQSWLTQKLTQYLSERTGTTVAIEHAGLRLPRSLALEGVYVEDRQGDTLLYAGQLRSAFSLSGLLSREISIREVRLARVRARAYPVQGDTMNYQFLIDAFQSPASPDTTAIKEDGSGGWSFRFPDAQLRLSDIDLYCLQPDTTLLMDLQLQNLEIDAREIDLQAMRFNLDRASLRGADLSMVLGDTEDTPEDTTSNTALNISTGTLLIEEVSCRLRLPGLALNAALDYAESSDAALENAGDNLAFQVPGFQLRNGSFSYDTPAPRTGQGFDYQHLALDSIQLRLQDLHYNNLHITSMIEQLAAGTAGDFALTEARGWVAYSPDTVRAEGLKIRTSHSFLALPSGLITLPGDSVGLDQMQLQIQLEEASVSPRDVAYFLPQVEEYTLVRNNFDRPLRLEAKTSGSLADLRLNHLHLNGWHNRLTMRGQLAHPNDPERLQADLEVVDLEVAAAELGELLPAGTLPEYMELPQSLSAGGVVRGTLDSLSLQLQAQTRRTVNTVATAIQLRGNGYHLLDETRLRYELELDTLFTTRESLQAYLPPELLPAYLTLPDQLVLQGAINGTADSVQTRLGLVTKLDSIENHLFVQGTAAQLDELAQTRFDLRIDSVRLTPAGLGITAPDSVLPAYLRLPSIRSGSGRFQGSLDDLSAALELQTDAGQMMGNATLRDSSYTLHLDLRHIDPKAFFQPAAYDTLIGRNLSSFTLDLHVDGQGFDLDSNLMADVVMQFRPESSSLGWEEGARLAGRIDRYAFDGQLSVEEPGLKASLTTDINFNLDSLSYAFLDLDLKQLNLQTLQLAEHPLGARGALSVSTNGASTQFFDGRLAIRDVRLVIDSVSERLDSLTLEARFRPSANRLVLRSDFARGFLQGRFSYPEILGNVRGFVASYFAIDTPETAIPDTLRDNFLASIELFRPEILTSGLVPGLQELSPLVVSGTYLGEQKVLSLSTIVPKVNYRDIIFDSLNLEVLIREDTFSYQAGFNQVSAFGQFEAVNFLARGRARDGYIYNTLVQHNEQGEKRFDIGAVLIRQKGLLNLQFEPQALLNYEEWTFSENNQFLLGRDTLAALDWSLSRGDELLQLKDRNGQELLAEFRQFDLSLLSKTISYNSDYLMGTLDGSISFYELLSKLRLGADFTIQDFQLLGAELGDLNVAMEQEQPNYWEGSLSINGNGHDIALDASYRQKEPAAVVDLILDAKAIDLASLEPLLKGYAEDLKGVLSGQVAIEGVLSDPDITGSLAFSQTEVRLSELRALWKLDDQPIEFRTVTEEGVIYSAANLSNFTLRDSRDHRIVIDGNIRTADFSTYLLDLGLNADDFLIMNTEEKDNDLYYGYIRVDANGRLKGPFASADLLLNVTPVGNSRFVYNYPIDQIGSVETGEGIIEFQSFDSLNIEPARDRTKNTPSGSSLNPLGWDINVNASVNDDLQMRINTNPITGDHFEGEGEGDLAFRLTPKGKMELTGQIEIIEGSYLFTYSELVKREFNVLPESSLTWTGPVEDPELDIRAEYVTKASARPLATNYESLSLTEQSQLKNRQEFQVIFHVTGELDDLEVSTRIDYPRNNFNSNYSIVTDQINQVNQDESQTNTQAFSLLLFNGFVSSGSNSGDMQVVNVQQSFSDLMTSYLNNIANQYIGFVELDFDIESRGGNSSDYFETTDFRVSIKKTFLQDRLEISVDGVASGGDDEYDSSSSNQQMQAYLDNITVEYSLTREGQFKVKVFNRRDVDDFLGGGQVVELGAALVFSKDFKSFRLFGKEKKASAPNGPDEQ